jgi:hypothetical protein
VGESSGLVDQLSGSVVGGRCSHGGAEGRREQREETATRHKGNWRVPCSCLCVKHPWLPTGVLHCPGHPSCDPVRVHKYPWQASQCGMGAIPHRMYALCEKKLGVYWGLVDKISPASEDSPPVNRLSPSSPVPPGQSPACTYLSKQHLQPLQIFNQSEDLAL